MKLAFISTMNKMLFEQYGERFLDEFNKHASDEIKLYLIFEGQFPKNTKLFDKVEVIPLNNIRHKNFIKKFGKLNDAKGLRINELTENGQKKVRFYFDIRWDSIKFSFKPFSIYQSLKHIPLNLDYLIWTDADLRCKKKFNSDDMKEFLPEDGEIMSFLGRKDTYSECGFLGFNLRNKLTKEFINRVIDIYETGEIFSLGEWHDSFIWDHVRIEFTNQKNGFFKNISGDSYEKAHVYINTKLGEFFDHLKGPKRKELGNSFQEDYNKLL